MGAMFPIVTEEVPIEVRLQNLRMVVCNLCRNGAPYDEDQKRHETVGPGFCEARAYELGQALPQKETIDQAAERIAREQQATGQSGSKITAIKELRSLFSLDLMAAKNLIEEYWNQPQ